MPDMLQQSESLIINGFKVFPIVFKDKIPLTQNGFKDATCAFDQIRKWDKQFQNYNIAIKTGEGICVIDIDPKNGGTESWIEITEKHDVPDTVCVQTGGGGRHYFFRGDIKNTANHLGTGIDTRGEGGYVVAPPSIHASGNEYYFLPDHAPDEIEIAVLPDFLNPNLVPRYNKKTVDQDGDMNFVTTPAIELTKPIKEGGRNDAIARLAGKYFQLKLKPKEVLEICQLSNLKNIPPLSDTEVKKTVKSIYNTHKENHPEVKINKLEKDVGKDDELINLTDEQIDVGGIVGMMCDEINACAYMRQPILTFGACLTFFATVVGKFYRLKCDTRANLYTVGIADSGSGKQGVITGIEIIADASGLGHLIDGEDITSGQAILTALSESRNGAVYFPFDEVGDMLAAVSGKHCANFEREKAKVFTTLYTSPNKTYKGKRFSSRKRIEINQPMVCFYGTGNPSDFFDAVTPKMIKSGFFGRLLCLFPRTNTPEPNYDSVRLQPSARLLLLLEQWATAFIPADGKRGDIEQARAPDPVIIEISDEAELVFREYDKIFQKRRKTYRDIKHLDSLWVRPLAIAKKISLILTLSNALTPRQAALLPKIDPDMARMACDIALVCFERTCLECKKNVVASDFEEIQRDLMTCIQRRGIKGATKSDLCREVRRWNPVVRDQAMAVLIEARLVFPEAQERKSKKPVIKYFVAKQ